MSKVILKSVIGDSYYITGIFSIGIYKTGNTIIFIDSGSDEQSAGAALDAVEIEGCAIGAIINTHCHPDHCGGNYFFQKKYPSIKIYAAYDEKLFIEDPKWAPRCFCGNAAPFAGLKNKHIGPQKSSTVTDIVPYQDGTFSIVGQPFTIITLPGHTPGSIGILTPDNVLYSGDALFGKATLAKHPILFYTDIENTVMSFKKLALLQVNACVLYHGGVVENLAEIVELHVQKVLETKDAIFKLIQQKASSIDELTQDIMKQYKIPENIISFTLTQTTIRAYLTKLESDGSIQLIVRDGLLQAII